MQGRRRLPPRSGKGGAPQQPGRRPLRQRRTPLDASHAQRRLHLLTLRRTPQWPRALLILALGFERAAIRAFADYLIGPDVFRRVIIRSGPSSFLGWTAVEKVLGKDLKKIEQEIQSVDSLPKIAIVGSRDKMRDQRVKRKAVLSTFLKMVEAINKKNKQ